MESAHCDQVPLSKFERSTHAPVLIFVVLKRRQLFGLMRKGTAVEGGGSLSLKLPALLLAARDEPKAKQTNTPK